MWAGVIGIKIAGVATAFFARRLAVLGSATGLTKRV
jgi:hypothetical protein